MTFTLMALLKELGYPHNDKYTNWELGAALRERFRERYGRLPDKQLGTKTIGVGSHCFAVYPDEFKVVAETIIHDRFKFHDQQISLI